MRATHAIVVVVLGASVARAESPSNPCPIDWWDGFSTVPTSVSGLPPEPLVLLPATWSRRLGRAPDLTAATVEVEVLDRAAQAVAGTLGAGLPGLEAASGSGLDRNLWWRPSAPLAAGLYSARVSVKEPPAAEAGSCGLGGFERTVAFEVAADGAPDPTATTDVRATVFQAEELVYGDRVCEVEAAVRCHDRHDICCAYLWPGDSMGLETDVTITAGVPGGPHYQALEVVLDDLRTGAMETVWVYPAPDGVWSEDQRFFPAPFERPFDVTRCATTRLWSLHELAVVSTSNDCARTRDAERLEPPGPVVCDASVCVAQPDTEVDATEGEGAFVEAAEGEVPDAVESVVADPDPVTETRDGSGCAGGLGASGPLGGLAGLLGPLVVILAGGRSSRFGRDKAKVEVLGVASLTRVRMAAEEAVGAERVVVHDGPAGGPLGAILESFARWPGRDLIVLACDLPLVDAATITRLAEPLDEADARIARVEGRAQPLAACYRASAAAPLRAAWDEGERSIVRALDRLRVAWVDAPDTHLADFDTPEELAAIEARAAPDGRDQGAAQPSRYVDVARNAGSG